MHIAYLPVNLNLLRAPPCSGRLQPAPTPKFTRPPPAVRTLPALHPPSLQKLSHISTPNRLHQRDSRQISPRDPAQPHPRFGDGGHFLTKHMSSHYGLRRSDVGVTHQVAEIAGNRVGRCFRGEAEMALDCGSGADFFARQPADCGCADIRAFASGFPSDLSPHVSSSIQPGSSNQGDIT